MATITGVWLAYAKFISDKDKDRESNERQRESLTNERLERVSNQYRIDLAQLSQFHVDEKQTIPSVIFLFHDLNDLYQTKVRLQNPNPESTVDDAALFVAGLVGSSEFDLNKIRNVRFDINAIKYLTGYSKYLQKNQEENMAILSKYRYALLTLSNKNKNALPQVEMLPGDVFEVDDSSATGDQLLQYVALYIGYKQHVKLLAVGLEDNSANTRETQSRLHISFCWFYGATKNKSMAKDIFGIDDIASAQAKCALD